VKTTLPGGEKSAPSPAIGASSYRVPITIQAQPGEPSFAGTASGQFEPAKSACTSGLGLRRHFDPRKPGGEAGHFDVNTSGDCFLKPAVAVYQINVVSDDQTIKGTVELRVSQVGPRLFATSCTDTPEVATRCSVVLAPFAPHVILNIRKGRGALLTSPQSPPPQIFPEDAESGMSIGPRFVCGGNLKGQGGAGCVWVTTPRVTDTNSTWKAGLWSCPSAYPFPMEVLLGFDPLWEDLSSRADPVFVAVGTVSFTRFKPDGPGRWLSFRGLNEGHARSSRGYVAVRFSHTSRKVPRPFGQVRFACSNKAPNAALP
jgi:hypothetical protein